MAKARSILGPGDVRITMIYSAKRHMYDATLTAHDGVVMAHVRIATEPVLDRVHALLLLDALGNALEVQLPF